MQVNLIDILIGIGIGVVLSYMMFWLKWQLILRQVDNETKSFGVEVNIKICRILKKYKW